MKLAITSKGPHLDDAVDPRFGRAAYIIIVDPETLNFEAYDNATNANSFKGAGIQAATMVNDHGANVLMTGYCGPKAFQIIEAAEIKVVSDVTGTVKDAVDFYKRGEFEYTTAANAEAHW